MLLILTTHPKKKSTSEAAQLLVNPATGNTASAPGSVHILQAHSSKDTLSPHWDATSNRSKERIVRIR